jgi:hypothetical protein
MTLVIGYADSEIGFLVADSLITPLMTTNFDKGPVAGKLHGLKIQIIHPDVAIAYASANDADAALGLIRDLSSRIVPEETADVPNRLFAAYQQVVSTSIAGAIPDCEFLVLRITPKGKELTHVTQRQALHCTRAYIGDSAEYKRLTELRKPSEVPKMQAVQQPDGTLLSQPLNATSGEKEFAETSDAMLALVHQRRASVGAIGGCVVRVVDARISRKLEYLQEVEASEGPAEGSSGFSLLASNSGVRGIGIYYPTGKVGFMLFVGDPEYVRKESAATIEEFIKIGAKKYGLELVGGKGSNWT